MIYLGTLQVNGFSYIFDGDNDIMKFTKGALIMLRRRMISSNIYKLLGNLSVGNVAAVEFDYDANNLSHMCLGSS